MVKGVLSGLLGVKCHEKPYRVLCVLPYLVSFQASAVVERTITDEEYNRRATWVGLAEVVEIHLLARQSNFIARDPVQALYRGSSSTVALVPGGTVGHLSQVVPGGPKFAVGEVSLYALGPLRSLRSQISWL